MTTYPVLHQGRTVHVTAPEPDACPCGGECPRVAVACLTCVKTERVPHVDVAAFEADHRRHVVIMWHPEAKPLPWRMA